MLADPTGKKWYEMVRAGGQEGVKAAVEIIVAFSQGTFPEKLESLPGSPAYRSAWEETIAGGREVQRAGPFYRLYRLRVDLQHRRQQPSPGGDIP